MIEEILTTNYDGRAELLHDVGDDRLVGDTDADGFLLALEDARDVVVGLQNESERSRQVALHHLKDIVVDGFSAGQYAGPRHR